MRSTVLVSAALCGPALSFANAAEEGQYAIGRFGNALLITAPAGGANPALGNRLNQRVTIDFVDTPLTEVMDFLRQATGTNIVVAPGAIVAAPAVTLKAADMALGNVLNWVKTLTRLNVGFVNGAIFISDTPVEGASVTRIYDVSDLTMNIPDFPGPELHLDKGDKGGKAGAIFTPAIDTKDKTATTDDIVEVIKKHIAPGQWHE